MLEQEIKKPSERSEARKCAFELSYSLLIDKDSETIDRYKSHSLYEQYILKIYDIISKELDNLTSIIQKHAEGFKLSRLYKVDLAILLVAVAEILHFDNIPYEVSINEALELAKIYSTENSPKYINGVLSGVLKNLNNNY